MIVLVDLGAISLMGHRIPLHAELGNLLLILQLQLHPSYVQRLCEWYDPVCLQLDGIVGCDGLDALGSLGHQ